MLLESLPQEQFLADPRLVTLRGNALIQLGDLAGAYRCYREVVVAEGTRQPLAADADRGLSPYGGELRAAKGI